jgi:transposase-like protein
MKQYSEELKAALVEKMLPPQNVPVGQLARETGIPKDTARTPGGPSIARRAV